MATESLLALSIKALNAQLLKAQLDYLISEEKKAIVEGRFEDAWDIFLKRILTGFELCQILGK